MIQIEDTIFIKKRVKPDVIASSNGFYNKAHKAKWMVSFEGMVINLIEQDPQRQYIC